MDLAEFFAADGPLARVVTGYRPREGQLAMAAAVADSLAGGEHLVVEAGTGIGKTYAYLVPCLLAGERTVISTGTRTLQDQLFQRDLPLLSAALGRPLTVALLKGRANYLCHLRLDQARSRDDFSAEDRLRLGEVADWKRTTSTGDLAELTWLSEQNQLRAAITSTRENCLGSRCEHYEDCFVLGARQKALAADVVIVNHHLLLADLVLKEEGFGELLPGFTRVIVDEAHQLPDLAQVFFSRSIGSRQIESIAADIRALRQSDGLALEEADTGPVEQAVVTARRSLSGRLGRRALGELAGDELGLADLALAVGDLAEAVKAHADSDADWQNILDRLKRIESDLDAVERGLEGNDQAMTWMEVRRGGRFTLHVTPFDSGAELGKRIDDQAASWVFTSATLAVDGQFDHFLGRVGIAAAETCEFPSPFDYENNARLFLPAGLPTPAASGFTNSLLQTVLPLVAASGGGAFLLFTSHRALNEARDIIKGSPYLDGLEVLVQGDEDRSALLARFRRAGNGVLFGTGSFWEGVDVRGDALRLVVVDKLPFAPPNDPLVQARIEQIKGDGGEPFWAYQVPEAILTLKQGVGRLIRDFDDRGVIVIGDRRLVDKPYGRAFLRSLPPIPVVREVEVVRDFLTAMDGSPRAAVS